MKNLLDVIIYIFKTYPKINELSKPRLVKLIYLIDWKYTIDQGNQYTEIKWYFNHDGPYVENIIKLIKERNDLFSVQTTINSFGGESDKILLKDKDLDIQLSENIKSSINFIISNTSHMNWSDFMTLIYSTYPILSNSQYTELNLVKDAEKFKIHRQQNHKA
jgi:hypothetical protein